MHLALTIILLAGSVGATDIFGTETGIAVPVNTWVHLTSPAGYVPAVDSGWGKLQFIPTLNRACMLIMGYRSLGTEPDRSLVCYSAAQNRWDVLDNNSTYHDEHMAEAGHAVAGFGVDTTTGVFYGPLAYSGSNQSDSLRWTWAYDTIGQVGRARQTPTKPALTVSQPAGQFDPLNKVLVLHGGDGTAMETTEYNPATNTYAINVSAMCDTVCPPAGLMQASTAYNQHDGKIYLFGGRDGVAYENGLYRYDAATDTWEDLDPSGTDPSGREKTGFACSTIENKCIVYGGSNGSGILNDTWLLDLDAMSWAEQTPVASPTTPVGETFEKFAYYPGEDVFIASNIRLSSASDTWAYRLNAGGKLGWQTGSYTSPENSLNRNVGGAQTWAQGGAIGAAGATEYRAWNEIAGPGISNNSQYFHPYASTAAVTLGSTYQSILADAYRSNSDGVGDGTTTFVSAGGAFTTACGGSCAGFTILVGGRGRATISSVTNSTTVVLSATVPTGTGIAYIIPGGSSNTFESSDSAITVADSTPWHCSTVQNNSSFGTAKLLCLGWNGSAWALGGLVGKASTDAGFITQGKADVADVDGTLTIAFNEQLRDSTPYHIYAQVKQWDGDEFVTVGGGPLNRDGDGTNITQVDSVAVTSNGTNPCAAWTEFTTSYTATTGTDTKPKLYVSCLDMGAWDEIGGDIRVDTTNGRAYSPSITWMDGQPYVAYCERTDAGYCKLYVRTTADLSTWSTVGAGPLNIDTSAGWAFKPKIVNDGTNLYVTWAEQGLEYSSITATLGSWGERPQIYVKQWNGSAWSQLGGSVNSNTSQGSATQPSIVLVNGTTPTVLWGEKIFGNLRQMYAAAWDGSTWLPQQPAEVSGGSKMFGAPTIFGTVVIR